MRIQATWRRRTVQRQYSVRQAQTLLRQGLALGEGQEAALQHILQRAAREAWARPPQAGLGLSAEVAHLQAHHGELIGAARERLASLEQSTHVGAMEHALAACWSFRADMGELWQRVHARATQLRAETEELQARAPADRAAEHGSQPSLARVLERVGRLGLLATDATATPSQPVTADVDSSTMALVPELVVALQEMAQLAATGELGVSAGSAYVQRVRSTLIARLLQLLGQLRRELGVEAELAAYNMHKVFGAVQRYAEALCALRHPVLPRIDADESAAALELERAAVREEWETLCARHEALCAVMRRHMATAARSTDLGELTDAIEEVESALHAAGLPPLPPPSAPPPAVGLSSDEQDAEHLKERAPEDDAAVDEDEEEEIEAPEGEELHGEDASSIAALRLQAALGGRLFERLRRRRHVLLRDYLAMWAGLRQRITATALSDGGASADVAELQAAIALCARQRELGAHDTKGGDPAGAPSHELGLLRRTLEQLFHAALLVLADRLETHNPAEVDAALAQFKHHGPRCREAWRRLERHRNSLETYWTQEFRRLRELPAPPSRPSLSAATAAAVGTGGPAPELSAMTACLNALQHMGLERQAAELSARLTAHVDHLRAAAAAARAASEPRPIAWLLAAVRGFEHLFPGDELATLQRQYSAMLSHARIEIVELLRTSAHSDRDDASGANGIDVGAAHGCAVLPDIDNALAGYGGGEMPELAPEVAELHAQRARILHEAEHAMRRTLTVLERQQTEQRRAWRARGGRGRPPAAPAAEVPSADTQSPLQMIHITMVRYEEAGASAAGQAEYAGCSEAYYALQQRRDHHLSEQRTQLTDLLAVRRSYAFISSLFYNRPQAIGRSIVRGAHMHAAVYRLDRMI